jgi:hypothetical protein
MQSFAPAIVHRPQEAQENATFNPSAMKHFEKIPTDHTGIK